MTQKTLDINHTRFTQIKSLWNMMSICLLFLIIGSLCKTTSAFDMNTKLNLKPTKYTEWSKNITYKSLTEYNARGMRPLYEITQNVMWFLIRGEKPIPDGRFT